jgi:GH15 family glucan-1,4-alpha-glucosidase
VTTKTTAPAPLEDYALVGDTHAAALVRRDGSVDWLCVPRFDSDACFAALLGGPEHGRWFLGPATPARWLRRAYRPGSLVLETEHHLEGGVLRVTDFMPLRDEYPHLVRIAQCVEGAVRVRMELSPRFEYGRVRPWIIRREEGLSLVAGPDALLLRAPVPLSVHGGDVRADVALRRGEAAAFVLAWHASYAPAPRALAAAEALEETDRWWGAWAGRCTYDGPWREALIRSLVTIKALIYGPTGGMVAAPTTSLPERIGGVRNWDYRYCWVRDATFTLMALLVAGYTEEARAWRDWLLRAAAGEPGRLQIMYGLAGERRLTEWTVPWLPGYGGSSPVRVGNAASEQQQLDVYGELMDALHHAHLSGLPASRDAWALQRAMLEHLERIWDEPDEGIWEVRSGKHEYVHSKVMAWSAIDRAVRAVEGLGVEGPLERWRALRERIHAEVCARGFDAGRGAFTQTYGSPDLDASLLMIPLVGFLPARDPRVVATIDAIERELVRDGFVVRYRSGEADDGLPPGEGVFLPCTAWLADCLALLGRREDATRYLEALLSVRTDLGLLAEEYDPEARRLLGNFPQAFSHVALVNTIRNLAAGGGPAERRSPG